MFGVAITSSSPAVAARCAFVRADVGAVVSQNITDPRLGERALTLMANGATATAALDNLASGENMSYRQLMAVDGSGETAIFSGSHTLGVNAEAKTQNAASAGNLLANTAVPTAVVDGFFTAQGHFGERLVAALEAGLRAGGEAGPLHSAGIKIAWQTAWPFVDLRCDWSDDCPLAALRRAWEVYQPQMDDYVQRALAPAKSPSFGVPGDE